MRFVDWRSVLLALLFAGPALAQMPTPMEPWGKPPEPPPAKPQEAQPAKPQEAQPAKPQEAQPVKEAPSKGDRNPPPKYRSLVLGYRPSPAWAQDKTFAATPFWRLDFGQFEVQVWSRTRIPYAIGDTR